jgi:hypothetical protein
MLKVCRDCLARGEAVYPQTLLSSGTVHVPKTKAVEEESASENGKVIIEPDIEMSVTE